MKNLETSVERRPSEIGGSPPWRFARLPWHWIVFALGLLTGLIAVGLRSALPLDPAFDPYYFGKMGASVARGDGLIPFGNLIQRRAPLYPLVIGAVYFLAGERPLLIQLLQCVFLAATCVLCFDMGRRLFNARTGAVAGVLCALHPMMIRYVADLHLETQLTFLFTLMVWATVRFWEHPSIPRGASVGIAAGLASLTKAVALLYPGVFALGIVVTHLVALRRGAASRLPWKPLATMFMVLGLVILPWTIRNYRATGGHFVLISSGLSDAILRSYIFSKWEFALLQKPPYTDAENESNALLNKLCRDAGTECSRNDWETDQILNRAAKEKVKGDPVAYLGKSMVGLFTFWYQLTSLKNSLIVGLLAVVAWVFAIVGCLRSRREHRPAWLLLAPVLYLNLFLAALLALGRYSVPILPALLVLTAFGLDTVWSKMNLARTR